MSKLGPHNTPAEIIKIFSRRKRHKPAMAKPLFRYLIPTAIMPNIKASKYADASIPAMLDLAKRATVAHRNVNMATTIAAQKP